MSKPQKLQQGITSVDAIEGKSKQYSGSARIASGELTEDELLQSKDREQKLTGLGQERYAITREESEKQVNDFIDRHKI